MNVNAFIRISNADLIEHRMKCTEGVTQTCSDDGYVIPVLALCVLHHQEFLVSGVPWWLRVAAHPQTVTAVLSGAVEMH